MTEKAEVRSVKQKVGANWKSGPPNRKLGYIMDSRKQMKILWCHSHNINIIFWNLWFTKQGNWVSTHPLYFSEQIICSIYVIVLSEYIFGSCMLIVSFLLIQNKQLDQIMYFAPTVLAIFLWFRYVSTMAKLLKEKSILQTVFWLPQAGSLTMSEK